MSTTRGRRSVGGGGLGRGVGNRNDSRSLACCCWILLVHTYSLHSIKILVVLYFFFISNLKQLSCLFWWNHWHTIQDLRPKVHFLSHQRWEDRNAHSWARLLRKQNLNQQNFCLLFNYMCFFFHLLFNKLHRGRGCVKSTRTSNPFFIVLWQVEQTC